MCTAVCYLSEQRGKNVLQTWCVSVCSIFNSLSLHWILIQVCIEYSLQLEVNCEFWCYWLIVVDALLNTAMNLHLSWWRIWSSLLCIFCSTIPNPVDTCESCEPTSHFNLLLFFLTSPSFKFFRLNLCISEFLIVYLEHSPNFWTCQIVVDDRVTFCSCKVEHWVYLHTAFYVQHCDQSDGVSASMKSSNAFMNVQCGNTVVLLVNNFIWQNINSRIACYCLVQNLFVVEKHKD
jgi:hypothetical protein